MNLAALAAVLLVGAPAPADAVRLARYCSPSGDLCYGIHLRRGAVFLELDMLERHFSRYRLCVTAPRGELTCRTFRVGARGRVFGSSVRWSASFPQRGRGSYRVAWWFRMNRLGPALTFSVPVRI